MLDLPTQWLNIITEPAAYPVTTKFVDRIYVLINQTMPEFIRMTVTQKGKDYHSNQAIKQYKSIIRSIDRYKDNNELSDHELKQLDDIVYVFKVDFFITIEKLRNKKIKADRPKKISVHPEENKV